MKMYRSRVLAASLILLFTVSSGSGISSDAFSPAVVSKAAVRTDVPFVPTPEDVVAEMLRISDVKRGDVVYDLGCGDGRMVIAAAKQSGCRAVGVDIDPQRIRESRDNAEKAGVAKRVRFIEQNLFDADIREATVLMMYLYPDVNLKLRPKILKQMKPGSRVVSHAFDMGDWKPDKTSSVGYRSIYFWTVPANVAGTWSWAPSDTPENSYILNLEQRFQTIKGTLVYDGKVLPLKAAAVRGNQITFTVDGTGNGTLRSMEFSGRIQGDSIVGRALVKNGASVQKNTWLAERDPSTARDLDGGYVQASRLAWHRD